MSAFSGDSATKLNYLISDIAVGDRYKAICRGPVWHIIIVSNNKAKALVLTNGYHRHILRDRKVSEKLLDELATLVDNVLKLVFML